MLEGHYVWYLVAALLVSGTLAAGISYWVAEKYIAGAHDGDPLQKQGGLVPSQAIDRK
jgi:hypothetical protein